MIPLKAVWTYQGLNDYNKHIYVSIKENLRELGGNQQVKKSLKGKFSKLLIIRGYLPFSLSIVGCPK